MVTIFGQLYNEEFKIDDSNQECYENLIKWVLYDKTMECFNPIDNTRIPGRLNKGIYIAGPTGTGKTVATRVIAKLAYTLGIRCQVADRIIPLQWIDIRADQLVNLFIHGDSLEEYRNSPILCVQDIGTESLDALYMGNRSNVIGNIIEQRGDRTDLMTLFTSNIPINSPDLVTRYGERAVSRLFGMCNYLKILGTDRRKKF